MSKGKILDFFITFVALMMLLEMKVYAYLDPGTVTYVVQIMGGLLLILGIFRKRIFSFFKKLLKKKPDIEIEKIDSDVKKELDSETGPSNDL